MNQSTRAWFCVNVAVGALLVVCITGCRTPTQSPALARPACGQSQAAPLGKALRQSMPKKALPTPCVVRAAMKRIVADGLSTIVSARLAPNGRLTVAGDASGRLAVVDLCSGSTLKTIEAHEGEVRDVAFLSEGGPKIVSGGEDGLVRVWDWERGAEVRTLRTAGSPIRSLAVGRGWIAVGAEQSEVELFPWPQKGRVRQLVGHADWVRTVVFSPAGDLLASAGHDGTIRLWAMPAGRLVRTLEGHPQWVSALAFAPGKALLASAGFEKRIALWDLNSGKRVEQLSGHARRVADLAFDARGVRLVSASLDRTARVWDVTDVTKVDPVARLDGHGYQVVATGFSSPTVGAGQWVMTASGDGYLRLWAMPASAPISQARLDTPGSGELTFRNFTTGERVRLRVVDAKGRVIASALPRLGRFMRSMPDGTWLNPKVALVKLLYRVAEHFGRHREIVMISGYRSEAYNGLRTKQSSEVAKKSKHMLGEAMDLRIDGIAARDLHDYLKRLKAGGAGLYTGSQFVHMDVGPVRYWGGH